MYNSQLVFCQVDRSDYEVALEVEEGSTYSIKLGDVSFSIEILDKQPRYLGEPIYDQVPFMVDDIAVIMTALDTFVVRPPHPKGYVCVNCIWWDRETGQKYLTKQTHRYANGSFSEIAEIIEAISSKNAAVPLTKSNIGYCPKRGNGLLCGERTAACDQYKARPWLARLRTWWRLANK